MVPKSPLKQVFPVFFPLLEPGKPIRKFIQKNKQASIARRDNNKNFKLTLLDTTNHNALIIESV